MHQIGLIQKKEQRNKNGKDISVKRNKENLSPKGLLKRSDMTQETKVKFH